MYKNTKLVYETLKDVDSRFSVRKTTEDFPVYGDGGFLDSLDLVRLVITLEQRLTEAEGKPVSLSSSRAMSYRNNPYRTFYNLVDFVEECLKK